MLWTQDFSRPYWLTGGADLEKFPGGGDIYLRSSEMTYKAREACDYFSPLEYKVMEGWHFWIENKLYICQWNVNKSKFTILQVKKNAKSFFSGILKLFYYSGKNLPLALDFFPGGGGGVNPSLNSPLQVSKIPFLPLKSATDLHNRFDTCVSKQKDMELDKLGIFKVQTLFSRGEGEGEVLVFQIWLPKCITLRIFCFWDFETMIVQRKSFFNSFQFI